MQLLTFDRDTALTIFKARQASLVVDVPVKQTEEPNTSIHTSIYPHYNVITMEIHMQSKILTNPSLYYDKLFG